MFVFIIFIQFWIIYSIRNEKLIILNIQNDFFWASINSLDCLMKFFVILMTVNYFVVNSCLELYLIMDFSLHDSFFNVAQRKKSHEFKSGKGGINGHSFLLAELFWKLYCVRNVRFGTFWTFFFGTCTGKILTVTVGIVIQPWIK